ERRLREPALDRPLEKPFTGRRLLAGRAKGVSLRHPLENDPAPSLGVTLLQQLERGFDTRPVLVRGVGQLVHGERLRGDHEQRLQRASEAVERAGEDQAERAVFHAVSFSSTRWTKIRANGAAWSIAISPDLRSSKTA